MSIPTRIACPDCGRVFDLANPDDAADLAYGHDCEDTEGDDQPTS